MRVLQRPREYTFQALEAVWPPRQLLGCESPGREKAVGRGMSQAGEVQGTEGPREIYWLETEL